MTKKEKLDLKLNINNENCLDQNFEVLYERFTYNPLFKILFLLVILVLSVIFSSRIEQVSEITSVAIFGKENVITLNNFLTVTLISIGISIITFVIVYLIKLKKKNYDVKFVKSSYLVYIIYDMGLFILSSILTVLFCIMVVITPCNIRGSSMNNTYQNNDKVMIWSLFYDVENNDVIVFDSKDYINSGNESRFYIKRAIGIEGDLVEFDPATNYIYINKIYIETISEADYLNISRNLDNEKAYSFTIPTNKVLVLGDNRVNSIDSRIFGLIDEKDIIGKVVLRVSPFSEFGTPEPNYNR